MHDYDFRIRKYKAETGDIALRDAMFLWNSPADSKEARIVVVDSRTYNNEFDFFSMCHGACWQYWRDLSPEKLLSEMFAELWTLACREGVSVEKIHEAFVVIPEYRESLASDFRVLRAESVLDVYLSA